jgi:hypothetical protein
LIVFFCFPEYNDLMPTAASACDRDLSLDRVCAARADDALAAVVAAGAGSLIAEPWRVARIIGGADAMTIDELTRQAARRRRTGPSGDLNVAVALAQLNFALASPCFRAAWTHWRSGAE